MSEVRTNDANNANVNRIVRFSIYADGTTGPITGANIPQADTFIALQGPNYNYKHYGKIQDATQSQILAQVRLSLITRSLSRWAILVGVQVADKAAAGDGSAVVLEFETDRSGVYYNNAWSADQSVDKHIVADISDTVGIGGMISPKTKPGLQTMLDELADVTYDDGATFIFGTDSTTGVTLPDGTTATGPSLDNDDTTPAGLVVVWDNPAAVA